MLFQFRRRFLSAPPYTVPQTSRLTLCSCFVFHGSAFVCLFFVRAYATLQDGLEAYLPMAGLVDKEKERARLEKQAGKLTKDMEVLEKRLAGSNFVEKVGVRA